MHKEHSIDPVAMAIALGHQSTSGNLDEGRIIVPQILSTYLEGRPQWEQLVMAMTLDRSPLVLIGFLGYREVESRRTHAPRPAAPHLVWCSDHR